MQRLGRAEVAAWAHKNGIADMQVELWERRTERDTASPLPIVLYDSQLDDIAERVFVAEEEA